MIKGLNINLWKLLFYALFVGYRRGILKIKCQIITEFSVILISKSHNRAHLIGDYSTLYIWNIKIHENIGKNIIKWIFNKKKQIVQENNKYLSYQAANQWIWHYLIPFLYIFINSEFRHQYFSLALKTNIYYTFWLPQCRLKGAYWAEKYKITKFFGTCLKCIILSDWEC